MTEIIEILETTPESEKCAQVGEPNYYTDARLEIQAFVDQTERELGPRPGGHFKTRSNPHDFGSYLTVEYVYNPDSEAQAEYAMKVESYMPENWDKEAIAYLKEKGYTLL
jgi:hypothetical protein